MLSEIDVVQPDLLFVSHAKASIITEANIHGAPDLAVEILSESTRRTDEIIKRKLYEHYGVKEYWIIDPDLETVKIYRLTDNGYSQPQELTRERSESLTSPLFPDWALDLQILFS